MTPHCSNPVVHLELHTGDLPRARDLYAELCGWRPELIETRSGSYLSLELGGGLEGGIVECPVRGPLWLPYVEVDEIAEPAGPVGWRSVVRTAVGGELAFWQPKRRMS